MTKTERRCAVVAELRAVSPPGPAPRVVQRARRPASRSRRCAARGARCTRWPGVDAGRPDHHYPA
ncbi:hypothetical protein [Actinoallomurus soli]|uniref:hypothetical protein n=1 Tax=Actinoallomurus soli TaxID=2952535 RepID=UPI002092B91A|nr:hypothetical protein [Actinoallomurus soli]MCO5972679.1 hypothetical protein [Actinoallomurus soli]